MSQRLYVDPETLARLAESEREHRSRQLRAILILAISVLVGLGGIVYALNELGGAQPAKVVIDPAKLPPIRPGPPR